jgi:hypothetical protein
VQVDDGGGHRVRRAQARYLLSFYERSRSPLTSNEAGVEFSYKQCACDSYVALIANRLALIARFLLTSRRLRRVL